jgi:hypothetical protein
MLWLDRLGKLKPACCNFSHDFSKSKQDLNQSIVTTTNDYYYSFFRKTNSAHTFRTTPATPLHLLSSQERDPLISYCSAYKIRACTSFLDFVIVDRSKQESRGQPKRATPLRFHLGTRPSHCPFVCYGLRLMPQAPAPTALGASHRSATPRHTVVFFPPVLGGAKPRPPARRAVGRHGQVHGGHIG